MTNPLAAQLVAEMLAAADLDEIRGYTGLATRTREWAARIESQARGEWLPIESAPKDRVVILWNADFITLGRWWEARKCWIDYADDGAEFNDDPTHWQPLPPAPLAEESK